MKTLSFLCLAALLAASPSALAILMPLDGRWVMVDEESDGDGGYRFGTEVSLQSSHRVELCLTDLYVPGEVYEVYVNGKKLGATGGFDPELSGDWTADPEEAMTLGSFSYGKWVLDPGDYLLSFLALQRPSGEAFRDTHATLALSAREIPQPVPEGGSNAVLLAGGLLGLASGGRLLRGRRLHR